MQRTPCYWKLWVCAGALAAASQTAHAGVIDTLFGSGGTQAESPNASPGQRLWRLREFTAIQIVPREAGTAENQQPAPLQPEVLRQQLMLIQTATRGGSQPLFAVDELNELLPSLVQAFKLAGRGDDVLLLSASKREAGLLGTPTAITARLFMTGDELALIVHDTRFEFYERYRGTQTEPRFTYGARTAAGGASIESSGAPNRRADWLLIPMRATATAAPMPTSAAPVTTGNPTPLNGAEADAIARRLDTIKRLRDKGAITPEEYQQKRKEILQHL